MPSADSRCPAWATRLAPLPLAIGWWLCSAVGCSPPAASESQKPSPPLSTLTADVITLEPTVWPTIVRSQGSLYADEQSAVGAKVAGRVAQVHVDLGDPVRAGDAIATLDEEEFRLLVSQAEAQLRQARSAVGLRDEEPVDRLEPENSPPVQEQRALWDEAKSVLARAAKLRDQDAIAAGEYDQAAAAERVAEARYRSAINAVHEKIALIAVRQAELSLARQRCRDAVITAPLDGFVQQRHVAVGSYLTVGQTIAVLVRNDPLRFRGTVPERHAQALAVGQEVRLQIESVAAPVTAKIARVSPTLDQLTRALVFEAEVVNRDHQLRSGLFAQAEVVIDAHALAMVLPDSAILEFAGTQKVWKVVDGVAVEQEVLTGTRQFGSRVLFEGLAAGDRILRDASQGRVARIEAKAEAPRVSEKEAAPPELRTVPKPAAPGELAAERRDSESS